MAAPKITIAGIAQDGGEGQFWQFASGAGAPEVPIVVSARVDEQLGSLPAEPLPLEVSGAYYEGTQGHSVDLTVEGLYLTRRHTVERGHRVRWFLTDLRWFFQKLWVFSDFCMRRPIDEFNELGAAAQRFFFRSPKLSYLPHTMKKAERSLDPRFAQGDESAENLDVWTAYEACLWMLSGFLETEAGRVSPTGLGSDWKPEVDVSRATDNKHRLTEFRTNKPWPVIMQKLLDRAHLGLYVDHAMRFVLYNLDPGEGDLEGLGGYTGAGRPVRQAAARSRPRRGRVFFRTEREVRFDYIETADGTNLTPSSQTTTVERGADIDRRLEIETRGLRNVLILPQDIRDPATGRTFQRGAIVTIEKGLELYNNDPDNPPPNVLLNNGRVGGQLQLSLQRLRETVMSPALAMLMTLQFRLLGASDDLFAARASSLYNSFRQVFQLPTPWLEFADDFRAELVSVADPVTGKRVPSPVYMDHFVEYSGRFHINKTDKTDAKGGINVPAWRGELRNVSDPALLPLSSAVQGPFKIQWLNKRQGVFKIQTLPDLYGNTQRVISSTFADDKIPVSFGGGADKTWFQSQMVMSELHRLSIVLSLTLRVPNDHRRFYFMDFGKGQPGGPPADAEGPNHETFFASTFAGFAWDDETSKVSFDEKGGSVQLEGGRLVNPAVIEDAAKAVMSTVNFRTADRVLGDFKAPGWDEERDRPRGSVVSVTIAHNDGRIEVIHDAKQPPAPPPFFTLLPTATANFLYRIEGSPDQ